MVLLQLHGYTFSYIAVVDPGAGFFGFLRTPLTWN